MGRCGGVGVDEGFNTSVGCREAVFEERFHLQDIVFAAVQVGYVVVGLRLVLVDTGE